jgi:xanthine/CO dehydrogenase XdhC/CoxF family maturation factor
MTHELKEQLEAYMKAREKGLSCVMASLVALDGSSYRRPGVFMLIVENGDMVGAVSGGCVEKEILKQSGSVFFDKTPKMITYDGRYRLGCDGILYILIEPFDPGNDFVNAFNDHLKTRKPIGLSHTYNKNVGSYSNLGTKIHLDTLTFQVFQSNFETKNETADTSIFRQEIKPCFRLIIIGAEHDAAVLCKAGASLGWEVTVVTSASDPQSIMNFTGAEKFLQQEPESLVLSDINEETAIVLMTHSYARDLKYLLALKDTSPLYLGMLGPARRRDKLLNEFSEFYPEVNETFFEVIHGPAGIDIGAETPQEIALSICSEILTVHRNRKPESLRDRSGTIHCESS